MRRHKNPTFAIIISWLRRNKNRKKSISSSLIIFIDSMSYLMSWKKWCTTGNDDQFQLRRREREKKTIEYRQHRQLNCCLDDLFFFASLNLCARLKRIYETETNLRINGTNASTKPSKKGMREKNTRNDSDCFRLKTNWSKSNRNVIKMTS